MRESIRVRWETLCAKQPTQVKHGNAVHVLTSNKQALPSASLWVFRSLQGKIYLSMGVPTNCVLPVEQHPVGYHQGFSYSYVNSHTGRSDSTINPFTLGFRPEVPVTNLLGFEHYQNRSRVEITYGSLWNAFINIPNEAEVCSACALNKYRKTQARIVHHQLHSETFETTQWIK